MSIVQKRLTRAPLTPINEGWRRFALPGVFALAVLGVLTTLGMIYLLPLVMSLARGA
jgi:hypothetical protein